ncbi:MAG: type 1 glutamine amidotransferase [Rhodobacteraceae bacterium]|nr:type 1 glutamine amidotransferase [Paracoccaceae bacterium]
MKILVLQHARVEHPGSLRDFLREDGHSWHPVELDEGEALPGLDGYDALWVLGGPMDVWQESEFGWLRSEKELIREAVEVRGMPFLGLCLGHQLLAEALGGKCGKAEQSEVGVMDVSLTGEGEHSLFFDGVAETFKCLQWHGAEVTEMPPGAVALATSEACAVQAMSWGPRAFSAQFHVEVEADTVSNWAAIPDYADALRAAFGENGVQQLSEACAGAMPEFNRIAERVYLNWLHAAVRS